MSFPRRGKLYLLEVLSLLLQIALQTGGQVSDTWTCGRHFSCQPTKGGMAGADFQQQHGKTGKTSRQAGNANQQDRLPELGRRAGSGWHQWHFFHTNLKVEVKLQKHYTHAEKKKESWGYKQPERIPNLRAKSSEGPVAMTQGQPGDPWDIVYTVCTLS